MSDLVSILRRFSTSFGDQMDSVLSNAVGAFLESERGGTLIDLRQFLIDKNFRNNFLRTVKDENILFYWEKTFSQLKSNSIAPLLIRLDSFLRPKKIRNMVGQKEGLNFAEIINSHKILLVKLPQGLIGSENSFLLGALIVSKLHQAALARQAINIEDRKRCFLYVDEFQHFITESMTHILSGGRKFSLGLVLAHQGLDQISKMDSELLSSVISNASTRICFRLGDFDAKKMEDGFSFFDANDLQNLGVGEAIVKVERRDFDFNLKTLPPAKIDEVLAQQRKEKIIKLSREKYSTPIEKIIINYGVEIHEPKLATDSESTYIIEQQSKKNIKKNDVPILVQAEQVKNKEIHENSISNSTEPKNFKEHLYLQALIKKIAETKNFKATIEEPTPDGTGRIDVVLQKGDIKIAIEVSITTPEEWEIGNILKCLKWGYNPVILCSPNEMGMEKIKASIKSQLNKKDADKILFFDPADLIVHLEKLLSLRICTKKRSSGYNVQVEKNDTLPTTEIERKREAINQLVSQSLKRINKRKS